MQLRGHCLSTRLRQGVTIVMQFEVLFNLARLLRTPSSRLITYSGTQRVLALHSAHVRQPLLILTLLPDFLLVKIQRSQNDKATSQSTRASRGHFRSIALLNFRFHPPFVDRGTVKDQRTTRPPPVMSWSVLGPARSLRGRHAAMRSRRLIRGYIACRKVQSRISEAPSALVAERRSLWETVAGGVRRCI